VYGQGNNCTAGNENHLLGLLFAGCGMGKLLIRRWDLSNCRGDGNMFLSPYRINSYSQGILYRLDDMKCLYSSRYEILLELSEEGEWLGHVQCCVT